MKQYANWSYPTEIRFGSGRIQELVEVCVQAGITKPLLITDRILADMPITNHVRKLLEDGKCSGDMYADVDSNPTEKNLAGAILAYHNGGYDGVIAFGGGSSLDLGKALAFMAGQSRPVWDFEDREDWWTRADTARIASVIAVPTTAGTGSEVGRAAVLTNSVTHEKKIIFHPQMLSKTVICDPQLTVGMPPPITAGTGLDAFAHCLEAYCSPSYHPMGQGIALEGMRLVMEYLPRAFCNGEDIQARAHMMAAATMGATAFQKGLGAIHALSHPIGAMYHTHHGTTNAVCMPAVLRFNRPAIEEPITRAAHYLGIDNGFDGFYQQVCKLIDSVDVPRSLSEMGIANPDINTLVHEALKDPSAAGNPIAMNQSNTRQLLSQIV